MSLIEQDSECVATNPSTMQQLLRAFSVLDSALETEDVVYWVSQ